jgi:predicted amidophosphoribosyltransferase
MNVKTIIIPSGWGFSRTANFPGYKCPNCLADVSDAYNEGTGVCPHCNGEIEKSAQAQDREKS